MSDAHDGAELRLESDEDAVQIVTIHGSKGLQYRFVYVPYLWCASSEPKDVLTYPTREGRVFDVRPRWDTSAKEVDEEEFFYSRETGGTIVSSALKLMHKIIESRYSPAEWNIYAAQASDGDNWNDDSPICSKLLADSILPLVQYYAYVEITPQDHQMLWYEYEKIQERFPQSFALQQIADPGEIYPVFRQLFERKAA